MSDYDTAVDALAEIATDPELSELERTKAKDVVMKTLVPVNVSSDGVITMTGKKKMTVVEFHRALTVLGESDLCIPVLPESDLGQ